MQDEMLFKKEFQRKVKRAIDLVVIVNLSYYLFKYIYLTTDSVSSDFYCGHDKIQNTLLLNCCVDQLEREKMPKKYQKY